MKLFYITALMFFTGCVSMSKYQKMERAYIDLYDITKAQNAYFMNRVDSLEVELIQCQDVDHSRKDLK